MDSLATLDIPAIGYGIRYEYGIFDQQIRDGWQVESTDKWLRLGNPWALERPEDAFEVKMGGRTERHTDAKGGSACEWIPQKWCAEFRTIRRFWATGPTRRTPCGCGRRRPSRASTSDLQPWEIFRRGGRQGVQRKHLEDSLSQRRRHSGQAVAAGAAVFLRLVQLAAHSEDSATQHRPLAELHRNFAIQMNDTHPAIAVAELMRLLIDEHAMEWDAAWHVTQNALSYTNHTLLPEALEQWPLGLFGALLPRHLEIIDEINRRHLDNVRMKFPGDEGACRGFR
jgi:glycogen phosphorylase